MGRSLALECAVGWCLQHMHPPGDPLEGHSEGPWRSESPFLELFLSQGSVGWCRGPAGPHLLIGALRTVLPASPAHSGCPPLGQYHFPGMEIRGAPPLRLPCLMASPSGLWTASPCPCPPHTEPRAPGPFLFLSLGFHTGHSLHQGHCSRCGLAPGAFLTRVSGPSGTRVMGSESRLLVACVRAPAP